MFEEQKHGLNHFFVRQSETIKLEMHAPKWVWTTNTNTLYFLNTNQETIKQGRNIMLFEYNAPAPKKDQPQMSDVKPV